MVAFSPGVLQVVRGGTTGSLGIEDGDGMRTSITKVVFAALALTACLPGCGGSKNASTARVTYVTKYAAVEFTFPPGWYEDKDEHDYDLRTISPSESMNTGVFAYMRVDIAADATPTDIFWKQINDMKSKTAHFEEFKAIQKIEGVDKTITSIVYKGDEGLGRYCYRFSLIEFKEDASKFAVAIQVATPGRWVESEPVLNEIMNSAKALPDKS